MDDIERLKELLAKATQGEWHIDHEATDGGAPIIAAPRRWPSHRNAVCKVLFGNGSEDPEVHHNAQLIVEAHNALPTLLSQLEDVRARERKLSSELADCAEQLEEAAAELEGLDLMGAAGGCDIRAAFARSLLSQTSTGEKKDD